MMFLAAIAGASVVGCVARPLEAGAERSILHQEDMPLDINDEYSYKAWPFTHSHGHDHGHKHFTMTVGGMLNTTEEQPWKPVTYGGACMDFNIGAEDENGGPARVDPQCNGDPSKTFYIEGEMIKNDLGHCLDVYVDGEEIPFWKFTAHPVVHYPCHGYSNQLFTIWKDQPKKSQKDGVMITSRNYAPGEERCLFMDNTPGTSSKRGKKKTPGMMGYVYAMNCTLLASKDKFKETSVWNFGLDFDLE